MPDPPTYLTKYRACGAGAKRATTVGGLSLRRLLHGSGARRHSQASGSTFAVVLAVAERYSRAPTGPTRTPWPSNDYRPRDLPCRQLADQALTQF